MIQTVHNEYTVQYSTVMATSLVHITKTRKNLFLYPIQLANLKKNEMPKSTYAKYEMPNSTYS